MASVVFEKQAIKIQEGLANLRKMHAELKSINKQSTANLFDKFVKNLREAEENATKISDTQKNITFAKATASIKQFNSGLNKTTKYLDSIYAKLKMIGLASMAGIGSIAAISAAMGKGATSQLGNTHKAKSLGLNKRQVDIYTQLGSQIGQDSFYLDMLSNLQNVSNTSEGNSMLATLGLNQSEFNALRTFDKIDKILTKAREVNKPPYS